MMPRCATLLSARPSGAGFLEYALCDRWDGVQRCTFRACAINAQRLDNHVVRQTFVKVNDRTPARTVLDVALGAQSCSTARLRL